MLRKRSLLPVSLSQLRPDGPHRMPDVGSRPPAGVGHSTAFSFWLALKLLPKGRSYSGLIAGDFVRFLDRGVHMGDRNGWVRILKENGM